MTGSIHLFQYFKSVADRRIFDRRDASAAFEVMRPLVAQGYGLGECLLNFPHAVSGQGTELRQIDTTGVTARDLILQTTRPPKSDVQQGARKQVPLGCSDIESLIFDAVDPYIDICARTLVTLSPGCARKLPHRWRTMAWMDFKQNGSAEIQRHRAHSDDPLAANPWTRCKAGAGETLVFLVRTDSLWPDGPGLLAAWGMTGETTLAWAYRLGHDLAHLLEGPRFVMAKMTFGGVPDARTQVSWANDLPIEIILDLAGDEAELLGAGPRSAERRGPFGRRVSDPQRTAG